MGSIRSHAGWYYSWIKNEFINGLTKQKQATNYSMLIGDGYVLLHLIVGVLVGLWASILPRKIAKWRLKVKME